MCVLACTSIDFNLCAPGSLRIVAHRIRYVFVFSSNVLYHDMRYINELSYSRGLFSLVEFKAQYGITALMWAAQKGCADCIQLLIDGGADVKVADIVRADVAPRSMERQCWLCRCYEVV